MIHEDITMCVWVIVSVLLFAVPSSRWTLGLLLLGSKVITYKVEMIMDVSGVLKQNPEPEKKFKCFFILQNILTGKTSGEEAPWPLCSTSKEGVFLNFNLCTDLGNWRPLVKFICASDSRWMGCQH